MSERIARVSGAAVVACLILAGAAIVPAEAQRGPDGPKLPLGQTPSKAGTPPVVQSCPTATSAAFLKIDGIEGDSQDVCHKREIELLTFQTGPGPSSLTVTKRIDATSPRLFFAVASGRHLPKVTISLLTASGNQPQWLTYTLTDVLVTSIRQSAGPATQEQIVLTGARFETKSQLTKTSLQPAPGAAAVDVALKIEGVAGDIVVLNVTDGVWLTSSGGTAARAQFLNFDILKNIDAASPNLMAAYQAKKHLNTMVITLRRRGSPSPLLTFKLSDVLVSGFSQTAGSTQRENVSLSFGRVDIEFPGEPGKANPSKEGWDLKQQKKV